VQLDGGRPVRGHGVAGFGGGEDAAVVAAGEGEPGAHFLGPGHDLVAAGFLAEAPGGVTGPFGGGAVDRVVLDAADESGEPARHGQKLAVLADGEVAVEHGGDAVQPGPALCDELRRGHVRVVAAEPVDGDAQAIQSGAVDGGTAQPGEDLQGVHTGSRDELGIRVPAPGDGPDRPGDGSEGLRDDRLVEVVGAGGAAFPRVHPPQHGFLAGQLAGSVQPERVDELRLVPTARLALGGDPPCPGGPVIHGRSPFNR
jgi:hypothetical protein